jgi:hypothetical protein
MGKIMGKSCFTMKSWGSLFSVKPIWKPFQNMIYIPWWVFHIYEVCTGMRTSYWFGYDLRTISPSMKVCMEYLSVDDRMMRVYCIHMYGGVGWAPHGYNLRVICGWLNDLDRTYMGCIWQWIICGLYLANGLYGKWIICRDADPFASWSSPE